VHGVQEDKSNDFSKHFLPKDFVSLWQIQKIALHTAVEECGELLHSVLAMKGEIA